MTLLEVAKKAGVSTTTVHRVLRGKRDVSPKTIKLVRGIMKDIGYEEAERQTNGGDSISAHFKTGCIGLVLVEKPVELLKIPMFVKLLTEIEQALAAYHLLVTVMQISDPEKDYPMLSEERLDGLLILGEPKSKLLRTKLRCMHSVGLLSSEHFDDSSFDWISSDFKSRGRQVVRYLQEQGHRRIAFLNPMPGHMGFEETGYHFQVEANKAGVQATMLVSEKQPEPAYWTDQSGRAKVSQLVEKFIQIPGKDRPTGIHVVNDEIAVSVYREMEQRGIKIGRDVEIISSGNHEEFLSRMNPRPATMDLNIGEISRRAVEKLIYRIKNPDAQAGITVLVPPRVVPAKVCFEGGEKNLGISSGDQR